MDLLGGAQGARRRDALLDVSGARRLHPRLLTRHRARRPPRPARQHGPPAPRPPARGRPRRGRARAPRHGRPARSTSTRSRRARPVSASTRRATRCSPACSPRSPSGSAPTATTPPTIGRAWGAEAGRRTRSTSCVKALTAEMNRLGFDPPPRRRGADHRHRVPALPVPGAGRGLPRARLQPAPRDLARASSTRSAGEASWSSRRCTTATRAGSRFRSDNLDTCITPSGGPQ